MASGGKRAVSQTFELPDDAPKYMRDALKDIGIQEWVKNGKQRVSNPIVQRYVAKALGQESWGGNTMTTPWCMYFVNAKLEYAGITGTREGMARSMLRWGSPVALDDWRVGDIIVFWRGPSDDRITGHVGFLLDWDGERFLVLGGNQSDQVRIEEYGPRKFIGLRRARGITQSRTVRANAGAVGNELAVKPAVDAMIPSKAQAIADAAEQIKSPLEMLAQYKPWVMGVLTAITVSLVLYSLYCRWQDHSSGRNT